MEMPRLTLHSGTSTRKKLRFSLPIKISIEVWATALIAGIQNKNRSGIIKLSRPRHIYGLISS